MDSTLSNGLWINFLKPKKKKMPHTSMAGLGRDP
jgi:hypothetical protein